MFLFLEYSISKDKVFCITCREFSSGLGYSEDVFTKYGYSDWKNIKWSLILHVEAKGHKLSAEKWLNFQRSKTWGSILSKLSSAHDMAIKENREYFTKIGYINNLFKISFFYKLLQFSLTLPSGSVKSEKSISALRRVFN